MDFRGTGCRPPEMYRPLRLRAGRRWDGWRRRLLVPLRFLPALQIVLLLFQLFLYSIDLFPEFLGNPVRIRNIADHPRGQEEDRFRLVHGPALVAEEGPENWDLAQPGNARVYVLLPVLDEP